MDNQKSLHNKKIKLTISTLSGDYSHEFKIGDVLQNIVEKTVQKLKLISETGWVLEHEGIELELDKTIEESGLKDGDILTLSSQEGGGGSRSQQGVIR